MEFVGRLDEICGKEGGGQQIIQISSGGCYGDKCWSSSSDVSSSSGFLVSPLPSSILYF
jgi:hypothetical protein